MFRIESAGGEAFWVEIEVCSEGEAEDHAQKRRGKMGQRDARYFFLKDRANCWAIAALEPPLKRQY